MSEANQLKRYYMEHNNKVYIKLQKHLDRQAIGLPATRSGVEKKILQHIFTPEEAEIACCLSYQFEPLETIFSRAEHLVDSRNRLEKRLHEIQKKGGIESKMKNGKLHYCNAPLVVGMYEYQQNRLTPEFIRDFNQYTSTISFGLSFLSSKLPQMRTIPVSRSIQPQHQVSTFDEVKALLQQAEAPFVIIDCICRKKKALEGSTCKATERRDTCLAIGNMARMALSSDIGREIARDEAISIIEQNQNDGLVLQPSNSEKAEFICSCCGCCCGMLRMQQSLPKPIDFWASNFYAAVDMDTCVGCGICVKRCQVEAISVSAKKQPAAVDRDRCIGCGLCVPTCPEHAVTLVKKPVEIMPPKTREALHELIVAGKKGRLGKLKLTGKLFVDSVKKKNLNDKSRR
jgi:NAD-dependent dihydropyrimidine dehydrogenase PreA subunit